jgi:hypothetical protein
VCNEGAQSYFREPKFVLHGGLINSPFLTNICTDFEEYFPPNINLSKREMFGDESIRIVKAQQNLHNMEVGLNTNTPLFKYSTENSGRRHFTGKRNGGKETNLKENTLVDLRFPMRWL